MGLAKYLKCIGACAVAVLVMLPLGAAAEDASRMEALESRLMALEDELKATRSALDHSEQMRQQGIPAAHVESGEGLDGFLSGLEVGGYVEASYLYNFNNPDSNTGSDPSGASGVAPQPLWQFNNNHNTFELDAVKLELGKSADEPGSAGFQIDLLFGANNHILCGDPSVTLLDEFNDPLTGAGGGADVAASLSFDSSSDDGVCVQEAYVSYNYRDIVFQFGKWETLLGYELIDAPYNNHVTHGMLFTWAIPLVHNGLLASGNLTEEIGWALGVTNGFNNMTDTGDNKGVIGQLSYSDGPFFASLSAFIGSEEYRASSVNAVAGGGAPTVTLLGKNDQQVWIYDFVATYDPTDDLHLWFNADYGRLDRDNNTVPSTFGASTRQDPWWWGAATGFKYQINEKVSLAMRGEYLIDEGGSRFSSALLGPRSETRVATGTATLGYALTSNLMARVEYRHDHLTGTAGDPYPEHGNGFCGSGSCEDDLDVAIVEVTYQFD